MTSPAPEMKLEEIPLSTYILSQEMANIQSGYAKWLNHRHQRFGSVFGRRFTKVYIEDEQSLKSLIGEVNGRKRFWDFEEFWSYIYHFVRGEMGLEEVEETSGCGVRGVESFAARGLENFLSPQEFYLRGPYVGKQPGTS